MTIQGELNLKHQGAMDPWLAIQGFSPCFSEIASHCPYGFDRIAVYRQASFGRLPDEIFSSFLAAGYRRNGNILYAMNCPSCTECVPIRLEPELLKLSRSQKRVQRKNRDLAVHIGPLMVDEERLQLCETFLRNRYPARHNKALEYYSGFFLNIVTTTVEVTYRVKERLVGLSIVDVTDNAMNAVYFCFDPEYGHRSLGTWNILHLAELCRKERKPYLYLGYWIKDLSAMDYKSRFTPHFLLRGRRWEQVGG